MKMLDNNRVCKEGYHLLYQVPCIIFMASVVGIVLLVLVYLLPTQNMKENIARSSQIYNYEGVYPQLVTGYKTTQLDNVTDTIMLAEAMCPVEGSYLKNAMQVNRRVCIIEGKVGPIEVTNYANDVGYPVREISYPRYWHGYLVWLKPLLLVFDVGDIRMLGFFLQSFLLLLIMVRLIEQGHKREAIVFGIGILIINPLVTAVSFQNATIYYILLVSILYLTTGNRLHCNYMENKECAYFFLCVGIITSYFDFLTYPLAALGVPLVFVIYFSDDSTWKRQIKYIVRFGCLFFAGYFGMWFCKWAWAAILIHQNIIMDALHELKMWMEADRSDMSEYEITIAKAIVRNVGNMVKWPYVILFLGGICYCLKGAGRINRKNLVNLIPYIVLMLIPFLHMIVSGHAFMHNAFTYREFTVAILAMLFMLLSQNANAASRKNTVMKQEDTLNNIM